MALALGLAVPGLVACGSGSSSGESSGASGDQASTTIGSAPDATDVYGPDLRTSPGWAPFQSENAMGAITEVENYLTVEDQARASSTVLRGRIRSVEAGRVFGDDPGMQVVYATLAVDPELVLAGTDPVLVDGLLQLEVPLPGVGDPADAPAALERLEPLTAGEPTVFFLRHKQEEAVALGAAAEERGLYRIVSSTGLVTADAGHADATIYLPAPHRPPIVEQIEALDMPALERLATVD